MNSDFLGGQKLMYNEIIEKLIEVEKSRIADWYYLFTDMYNSNNEQFSNTLIELRNTNLGCIDDESLIEDINNCSSLFSGRDSIILDIILLMLYFEIDVQHNINALLSNYQFPEFEKQTEVMCSFYYIDLIKIFTKSFTTYSNDKLIVEIDDYIDVYKIDSISIAKLYYSVIRDIKPRSVKKLPNEVFYIGLVCQAFGLIDGDGLSCFYRHFKANSINTLCKFLNQIGGEKYANIIEYGLDFRKDHRKLDHLENKIYNLEKKKPIDNLLNNYLKELRNQSLIES